MAAAGRGPRCHLPANLSPSPAAAYDRRYDHRVTWRHTRTEVRRPFRVASDHRIKGREK
ncbi:hypothetical protein GCM10010376_79890 [Streptomyces violaceusniger]